MTTSFYDSSNNLYGKDYNFTGNTIPKDCYVSSGYIAQDISNISELKHVIYNNFNLYDQSENLIRDSSFNTIPCEHETDKSGNILLGIRDASGNWILDTSGTECPVALEVNYNAIQPYLTKAIQELHQIVQTQETTISSLQTLISTLQTQNTALEARIAALEG